MLEQADRELERQIGAVCRGIAAQVAREASTRVTVTPDVARQMSGAARYLRESRLKVSRPGVVTALAYTPYGGEVLHKPIRREIRDLLERAWLLEKVRRVRHDGQPMRAGQAGAGTAVEFAHLRIRRTHDQQGRRPQPRQRRPREIGASTA